MDAIMAWWNDLITMIQTFDYAGLIKNLSDLLTFDMFIKIIIGYILILWVAIIIWVTKDIINRTNNIFYQVISILSVLILTPLGIPVYLLIRPSKTLFEKHYEESELDEEEYREVMMKEVLSSENNNEEVKCHNCGYSVQKDFKFCPKCRVELNRECNVCKKMIEPDWENCPYCGSFQGEEEKNKEQLELEIGENKEEEKKDLKSFRLFTKKKDNKKSEDETENIEDITEKGKEDNDKKLEEKISGDETVENNSKSDNITEEVKNKTGEVLEK
ncbi:MAG: zinc ribbon domain-containing protein [Candidatus Gracilibacteria bacterium]|nr:zinc ribbon domain-containing protein [Candidatus Gracilibacteria bacterium]